MDLSGRDQQRVVKPMARGTDVAVRQQRAGAKGDFGFDRMNSIAEAGNETVQPGAQRRAALGLA